MANNNNVFGCTPSGPLNHSSGGFGFSIFPSNPPNPFQISNFGTKSQIQGFKRLSSLDQKVLTQIKLVYISPQDRSDVLYITESDEVFAFGTNRSGRLGVGHQNVVEEPVLIKELCGKDVIKIISGSNFMAALTRTGEVWAWGLISWMFGQQPTHLLVPNRAYLEDWMCVQDIQCTDNAINMLTITAQIFWFGCYCYDFYNNRKQVVATHITAIKEHQIVSIACGTDHTLALTSTGKVFGWGRNQEGQLGLGHTNNLDSSSPQLIPLDLTVKQIACGSHFSLLLANNGNIYAFGSNLCRQLGVGNNLLYDRPQIVKKSIEFIEISAFGDTSMAISKSKSVYIWGSVRGKCHDSPKCTDSTSFQMAINCYPKDNVFTLKAIPYRQLTEKKSIDGLSQVMSRAFNNPKYSDLRFSFKKNGTEDQFDYIFVHKWFVSENSEYFAKLFADNLSENAINEFEIIGNSYEAYYHFIRYLYTETIETQDIEVIKELMSISDVLLDCQRKKKCSDQIKPLVSTANVCSIYSCARDFKYEELEEYCFDFMSENIKSIINTEDYELMADNHSKCFFTNYFKYGLK